MAYQIAKKINFAFMTKISVTILTYNEEKRIARCLESIKPFADEIVVVDSFSTDKTEEICLSYGCKVSKREFNGYGALRQYATSLTSYNYVFTIDADEVVSPQLAESIRKLKEEGFKHRVYQLNRLNFYCGFPIRRCGWYPDHNVRLFDKRYANWNLRDITEQVIFRDSVTPCQLEGDLLHHTCNTPDEYIKNRMYQAGIHARVIACKPGDWGIRFPKLRGAASYLNILLLKGGILEGKAGRDIARHNYTITKEAYTQASRFVKEK